MTIDRLRACAMRGITARALQAAAGAVFALLLMPIFLPTPLKADDEYPNRTIRIIVPYAPGGLPDTVARVVTEKMRVMFNQTILIENRPGFGGGTAASALLTSPPDGYTLLLTEGSILYNSLIIKSISYDWHSLMPVVQLAQAPQFLAVNDNVPAKSMKEFVDYVRSKPGALNYGSAGVGSPHHLAMEAVKSAFKLDIVHVPFKGSNEAVPALLGGHIDTLWVAYPSIAGLVKDGKIRLLAINSLKPSEMAPDVPPMANFIPGFNAVAHLGIFAKAGTPEAIVKKIEQAGLAAASDPAVKEKLSGAGIEASPQGSAEFTATLAAERELISKVVTEANIHQD